MARNASDGSSVRAALDLNQSGVPRMLFHEIAKIMECFLPVSDAALRDHTTAPLRASSAFRIPVAQMCIRDRC